MSEKEAQIEEEETPKVFIHQKVMKRVASKSGKTVYRKRRIGDLVAMKVDDRVVFGFSLCHKNDIYNRAENGKHVPDMGINRALARAERWSNQDVVEVPPSLKRYVTKFSTRCEKYFKDTAMQRLTLMEVDYPHFEKQIPGPRIPRH